MSIVFSGSQQNTITQNTGGDNFTVMCRVLIPTANSSNTLDIITEYGSRNTFRLYWQNGRFYASVTHSTIFIFFPIYNTTTINAPSTSTTDEWHHIAATYQNKVLTLYVDGMPVATGNHDQTILTPSSNTLGAQRTGNSSYTNYFRGEIEDYRIYSAVLAPEYIETISTHNGVDEIYHDIYGRWKLIGPIGATVPLLESVTDSLLNNSPSTNITYG